MKRYKILKIFQVLFFVLTTIIVLSGLKGVITAETEEAKGAALVVFLIFNFAIFGGIGYGLSALLGIVGLIIAIVEYNKTKERLYKNQIIYFAVSIGIVVAVFFAIYGVCLII